MTHRVRTHWFSANTRWLSASLRNSSEHAPSVRWLSLMAIIALAQLVHADLAFKVLYSETSQPVFGSVCPHKDELVLTLANRSVIYYGAKRTFSPLTEDAYGAICNKAGVSTLKLSADKQWTSIPERKNIHIPGRVYWHSWGIPRIIALDSFLVAGTALIKNGETIDTVAQVYGCSVSFYRYPLVVCNDDAHSSITFLPGFHMHGHHMLRTYASQDNSPSFSVLGEDVVDTNLPPTLSYIRYYANAAGAVYCVYLDDELYHVARLLL